MVQMVFGYGIYVMFFQFCGYDIGNQYCVVIGCDGDVIMIKDGEVVFEVLVDFQDGWVFQYWVQYIEGGLYVDLFWCCIGIEYVV